MKMSDIPINSSSSRQRGYGATTTANVPEVSYTGFSPTEFISLSEDIANNIEKVHSSSKQLERCQKLVTNSRDRQTNIIKISKIQSETNEKIKKANNDLQRLTSLVMRDDKQQKFQLEKLTNDFSAVIESYTKIQEQLVKTIKYNEYLMDRDRPEDPHLQQQLQLQSELVSDQAFLIEREEQARQIESNMLDVNKIMHNLSTQVHSQGQQVDFLENNIESASGVIEQGRAELEKAAEHRRNYRKKVLIILAIALIVGIITTAVVVSKISN